MFRKNAAQIFTLCLTIIVTNPFSAYPENQTPEMPLFSTYPNLKQTVAHTSLGGFPTPIQKLTALGTLIKTPHLYIKKDNESGIPFGGNKIRKLEFLFGDALACDAKAVLTRGYVGSNHTCATSVCAHKLGLTCICMHLPQMPTAYLRRNLLLSHLHGAELNYFKGSGELEKTMHIKNRAFKDQNGQYIYFIPSGGSNELGTIGFVNAAFELKQQIQQGLMPEPDYIYVAVGSCATTAGLMLGIKVAGLKTVVVPVCIEPEDFVGQHAQKVANFYKLTSLFLHKRDESFPLLEIDPADVTINHAFVGQGYAAITPQAHDAIALLQQTEGIKLDGSYTGKAFAGMLDDIANKNISQKVILFWNSFCSGDFADTIKDVDYKKLPQEYHRYFQCALQTHDQGC